MKKNNTTPSLSVRLGFARQQDVVTDSRGALRVPTRYDTGGGAGNTVETHWCQAVDLAADRAQAPGLAKAGFDQIDLAGCEALQSLLSGVNQAGELDEISAKRIRREVQGKTFRLLNGRRLKVLFVAPEGFIMRRSGPNGLDIAPGQSMTERNGHKAADQVHGDQNVYGTPLKKMLKRTAPWLFRHQTLGRRNRVSPVFLLNLWIPLQQHTQPLTLADRRSINSAQHQVCYALPTEGFLAREEDQALNDLWLFLHNQNQQWYCDTSMNHERAYVFDTLGAPHGAATLPGEDVAEIYFRRLREIIDCVDRGESLLIIGDRETLPDVPPAAPDSLRQLLLAADELMREVAEVSAPIKSEWADRARAVAQLFIRQSLEMRLVALVY
jgi:hypothetical protein